MATTRLMLHQISELVYSELRDCLPDTFRIDRVYSECHPNS